MKLKQFFILFLGLILVFKVEAKVIMPSLFCDNMILQQKTISIMTDAGEKFNIHPKDKDIVAKRLLYCALSGAYHIKEVCGCVLN